MLFAVSPKISLTRQRYAAVSPKVRSQRVIEVRPQKQDSLHRIDSGSILIIGDAASINDGKQQHSTTTSSKNNSSNNNSNTNNNANSNKRRLSINIRSSFVNENTIRTLVQELSTRQAPETAYIPPTTAFVAATNPRRVKMGSFLVGPETFQNNTIYTISCFYLHNILVPQQSTALSHIYSSDLPVDATSSRTLSPEFDALYNQFMVNPPYLESLINNNLTFFFLLSFIRRTVRMMLQSNLARAEVY